MKVSLLGFKGTWREVANSARTTISQAAGNKEPSSNWKRRMLLAEHSPIRQIIIKWKWYDLKYWISTHFVRHWLGIVHWVSSQRPDRGRTGNRDEALQSAFVEHECEANAQTIINISRKRLCNCAMPETRKAWKLFLDSLKDKEPELYRCCVPECVYRGFCPEYKSCGWTQKKPEEFQKALKIYREGVNGN